MNYKNLIMLAVVLAAICIVPVSAGNSPGVWRNDNFYTNEQYAKISEGCTMVYNPQSDVTSCIRDNNPAKSVEVSIGKSTCRLEGNVRCGYNTLTKEGELRNVKQGANETGEMIPVQADGTIGIGYDGKPIVLAQGDYTITLKAPFGLGEDQTSKVHCDHSVARPESELLGYAITATAPMVCSREIVSAKYGEHVCYDEVSHMEYRSCKDIDWECTGPWWKPVCHQVCSKWNSWQTTEPSNCKYSLPVSGCQKYCQSKKVTDKEAYCVGEYVDVTQNVREAVSKGYTTFLFSNGHGNYYGGIWDATDSVILSEIKDPARDQKKHVSIDYKDCNGMEQHVSTEEYEVITL